MQLPNVEEMSPEQKFWFASSIAGMVVADGQAVATELVFLKDAINFLENKEEIDKIMNIVKQGVLPELKPIEIEPKQAFLILKYFVRVR